LITDICIQICKRTYEKTHQSLLETLNNSSTQYVDCELKYKFSAA